METGRSTLVVDLGDQLRVVEERVRDGSYASPDEVIQAALRAFDGGDAEEDAWLVELAEKSLADPRPSVPAEQVFRNCGKSTAGLLLSRRGEAVRGTFSRRGDHRSR